MKKSLLFLSAFLLAACSTAPTEDEGPLKIGYIGPLTGDAVTYGADMLHGAEIKVAEINAAGGVNGREIQLIAEDGRCAGTDAASAAQKLINVDKVVAIVGAVCSGETLSAAPIANAAKVPMLSPGSTSPDVTNAGDYVYRNIPSDALAVSATVAHLREQGFEKIAIITENTDFAVAFAGSLTDEMGEDAVVFEETVDPGTKDFRTLVSRLEDVEFDAFVANAQTVAVAASMLIQLREQGFTQPTVGNNAIVSSTLSETAGEAAEGLIVVLPPSKGANAGYADFSATFSEQFGEPGSSMLYAALSHDALGLFAEAIAAVGTDGEAIRGYLDALTNYDGVAASFHFDENGDVKGIPFELQEVQSGEFVTIADIPLD